MTYTHIKHNKKTVVNGYLAPVGGRCGETPSALENQKNSRSNVKTCVYRTKTAILFPVFPAKTGLFPVLPGTTLLNGDNSLRAFFDLFPVFPVFFTPSREKTT